MRLTKSFCAFVTLLALASSGQVVIQTPAPASGDAATNNNDAVREALRKALGGETPAPTAPTTQPSTPTRIAPAEPVVPKTPAVTTISTAPGYPYAATNIITTTNGTVVRLSLEEAIRLALEHNRNLQVERYTPIIAEYDRRAAYGYYDPVFLASIGQSSTTRESGGFNPITGRPNPGSSSRTDFITGGLGGYLPTGLRYDIEHEANRVRAVTPEGGTIDPSGNPVFTNVVTRTWNSAGTITATQPLLRDFWIDNPRLQIKLKRRDVRITELDLERFVMDIINKVEQAYYALIANHELVRVGETDVAVKKQFLDENHRRVEVGTIAPLDEKLAQAELAKSEINLIVARKNAADSEAVLKGLIQDNFINQINVRFELTDRLLAMPANLEVYDAFKEAMEKRPDLQRERVRLERQQIQLKFDKNQLFPRLDLFGTWGVNGLDQHFGGAWDDLYDRRFPQDRYGLSLSFPLSMWTERNNYKASKAAVAKQILAYKQLEETVVQEVDFQIRLLRTTWRIIPLRREQTTYEQAALEAERKKELAGKSTSFNVLQIASDLALAQSDLIGTLRDYNQAISELSFRKGTTLERWHIDPPPRANR